VLRSTGIRIEELTELSHHSLVQHRLPATGELIPLLHITPSKTDVERLLVISPAVADVLAAIIHRVRGTGGAVPLVIAYDVHECEFTPAMPVLFQRHVGADNRPISAATIRRWITEVLDGTGLTDASGQPLRFTPHDFRRIFATEAIMNGLPPHICQLIMGHKNINTTMGYKNSTPRKSSTATGHSSPAAASSGPPPNTVPPPSPNGKNSSATSNAAGFHSATAAGHTAPAALTSTVASGAPCCGLTQPSRPG
jgi:integrase